MRKNIFGRENGLKKIVALGLSTVLALSLTACGGRAGNQTSTTAAADGVRVVKGGRVFASPPYNYNDENGNQTGFETEVVKAAFAIMDGYELVLEDTTDTDIWTGVQTGKYDFGYKTAWYTEERAAKFIVSKESSGVTTVGLLFRSENADKIKDLASFADFSGNLVPLAPSNAQYTVVEKWNSNNPDHKINLQATDSFDQGEAITWLLEGRYDGHIYTGHYYNNNVVSEKGAYHQFADKLSFFIYSSFPTYVYFNKDNADNQALADAFDEAIRKLTEDGTIEKLEIEYFGEDLYKYLDELAQLN